MTRSVYQRQTPKGIPGFRVEPSTADDVFSGFFIPAATSTKAIPSFYGQYVVFEEGTGYIYAALSDITTGGTVYDFQAGFLVQDQGDSPLTNPLGATFPVYSVGQGQPHQVVKKGKILAKLQGTTDASPLGKVYIRFQNPDPANGLFIGGVEATTSADVFPLKNAYFDGKKDALYTNVVTVVIGA